MSIVSHSIIKRFFSKHPDEPAYHQQVRNPETALHEIREPEELRLLCEERDQLYSKLPFDRDTDSHIVIAERFPDDGKIEGHSDKEDDPPEAWEVE